MDDMTRARRDAVRKEAIIGAMMNVVLGFVFFMLVFGWNRSATTSLAIDFLPQTVGMTLIGGMVASLISLSRVARGTMSAAGPVPTRGEQAARVLGCATVATLVFGGAAALLLVMLAPSELEPGTALALKSAYGILMGFVTIPPIVRMAFGMPFWPQGANRIVAGARR